MRGTKVSPTIGSYLCVICHRILQANEGPPELEIRHKFAALLPELPINEVVAAYTFIQDSPIQSLIHAFKYEAMPRLATSLGRDIAYYFMPPKIECIVPVPLHRTRLAERGYNQAEALARGLARESKAKVVHAVKRIRPTPSQTQLSISERVENVRGAFALTHNASSIKDKHVLIVDDVMTTGSTLASVAETVLEARPKRISILTLALAQRA